ncbi:estrogen receptor beta, partial [Brachionus plicatilis]
MSRSAAKTSAADDSPQPNKMPKLDAYPEESASIQSPAAADTSSAASQPTLCAAEPDSVHMEDEDKLPDADTFFLNCLNAIEADYNEKLESALEQHKIMKRMINLKLSYDLDALKQLMVDLVDQECNALISWAKCIPNFGSLTLEDQTYSIELNFLEVILVDCLWRSIVNAQKDAGHIAFVLNEHLIISRHMCKDLKMIDIYDHFVAMTSRLMRLQLTKQEYLCVKALVLFKSDYGFTNVDKLEGFRAKCLGLLKQTCGREGRLNGKCALRYESLLLALTDIKSISMRFMHYLIQFKVEAPHIQLPHLLYDMFLTQNMFGLTS